MKDQVVVDCETVGVGRGKVIISLAAVRFDLQDRESTKVLIEKIKQLDDSCLKEKMIYSSEDMIFMRLPILDSLRLGFTTDTGTLDFWGGQKESLFDLNLRMTPIGGVKTCLDFLDEWLDLGAKELGMNRQREGLKVWSNSPRFDMEMLEAYYDALARPFPVNFRDERDVRTIRKFFKIPYSDLKALGLTVHNPIHDCLLQALDMQLAHTMVLP